MFGGDFICNCRSVCCENVIVRRVLGMFGWVLLLRRLFRVSIIFGGLFGGLFKQLQFREFAMFCLFEVFGMFGGLVMCICRSVCCDNLIVRRFFGMFGGVLLFRGLFRVSVIFGGLFGGLFKPLQFEEFAMF